VSGALARRWSAGPWRGPALLAVALGLGLGGAAGHEPLLLGLAVLAAVVGVARLLADLRPEKPAEARELRIGAAAIAYPLGVLVHVAAGPLLWTLHERFDASASSGDASASDEASWLALVFAGATAALGVPALALARRVRRVASGAAGRVRYVVGVHAATAALLAECTLAVLVLLSQRERAAFELGAFFEESGFALWVDTFRTIAAAQGTLALAWLAGLVLGAALVVQVLVALSTWFLLPDALRARLFLVVDALVLAAFLFALYTLPFEAPEDGDATLTAVALAITGLFLLRAFFRAIPLLLDGIERSGFEPLVAARLLRARKSGFLTVISSLSILAVSFSSCTLTTTLSVMGGFRDDLQQKILGNSAHVVVDREYGSWEGWDPVLSRVRAVPGVLGASPFIEGEVMITSASNLGGARLRGIDPDTIVTDLPSTLRHGRIEYLAHPERLLDLRPDEMSGSLLERLEPVPVPPARDAGPEDAGSPDAGASPTSPARGSVELGGRDDAPAGLAREIDALLDTIDRELGPTDLSLPLAEPAPEVPDEDRARAARIEELDEFLLPEAPEERRRRERALDLLPGLIVGAELARSLRLHLGDEVNVVSPNGELGPTGPMPRSRPFRVAGIFYSGMFEYDMQFVYTDLATAQRFLGLGGAITGLQVRVDDWERAEERSSAIAEVVGRSELRVRSWQEVNRNLFGALQLEKLAMFIMLLLAILVASFCVVGALMLMVQEKGKEVGILKAMGAEDRQIVRMFLVQGLLIGLLGALSGCGLGYEVCFFAEHFGIAMNPEVYYIDSLPVHVEVLDFVAVGAAAVVVCLVATVYPAIVGSRLRPVDAIRQA
jgi:lipoprotein-releasing system permease protein